MSTSNSKSLVQDMRLPLSTFSNDHRHPNHIGEVIETTTTEFLAECLESEDLKLPKMPPFGSWVKSFDEESGNKILAIITYVTTSPVDSVHRARALGLSLAELKEQQPQIFAMLKTEFRAIIVGFESVISSVNGVKHQLGTVYQYLPPRPPQIHQPVYFCESDEIINFSQELNFLRVLLQAKNVPIESLVAAVIREIYGLRNGDRNWLIQASRNINLLLKNDYDTLQYILSQIQLVH